MNRQSVGPQSGAAFSQPGEACHLPIALSLIAGMVDVTSWLTLGGLFAAHITGNLVIIAADCFGGKSPHLAQVLAVPMFIAAVALADQMSHAFGSSLPRSVTMLLLLQTVLLIAVTWITIAYHTSTHPFDRAAEIAGLFAVSSMAVQNALLHLTRKQAPTTAVMTGNLVACTISLLEMLRGDFDRDEARLRWIATWPLLAGFLTGCLIGSFAVSRVGASAWIYPAGLSLGLALLFWKKQQTYPIGRSAVSA